MLTLNYPLEFQYLKCIRVTLRSVTILLYDI